MGIAMLLSEPWKVETVGLWNHGSQIWAHDRTALAPPAMATSSCGEPVDVL